MSTTGERGERCERNVAAFDADLEQLLRLVGAAGGSKDELVRDRLRDLAAAIDRWNVAINLVSRKDIGRLITYHFCDSASILPLLGSRLAGGREAAGRRSGLAALDVGGSNGLPGLVLAAVAPGMDLTICDSRRKRLGFLEEVCGGNARFELGRVDSPEFQADHQATFDLIVARAVTRLKLLAKWCLPLLKPSGRLVAYKGSRCEEELAEAQAYLFEHGASRAIVTASPWGESCNPLRIFAIVDKTCWV